MGSAASSCNHVLIGATALRGSNPDSSVDVSATVNNGESERPREVIMRARCPRTSTTCSSWVRSRTTATELARSAARAR